MKKRNEKTSSNVAAIAGNLLNRLNELTPVIDGPLSDLLIPHVPYLSSRIVFERIISVSDLKSLAASALTQAPDKQVLTDKSGTRIIYPLVDPKKKKKAAK